MKIFTFQRRSSVVLAALMIMWIAGFNLFLSSPNRHFVWLANSFAAGRLDIPAEKLGEAGMTDIVMKDGRFYWPLEPLPAVLMMPLTPFVAEENLQQVAQILASLALLGLAFLLARRLRFNDDDAVLFACLFGFGSMTIGVISINGPWYLGNTVAAVFVLAAVLETRGRNRPWLVGLLAGLAGLSRLTAGIGAFYFILLELLARRGRREKLRRLAWLALPALAAITLAAAYNYGRFGGWFDTGHKDHFLLPAGREAWHVARYGLFNAVYFLRNFYFYFLKLPELYGWLPLVHPYGVSVFVVAPVFLYAWTADRRRPEFIAALVASLAPFAVYLTYFTTGFWQFGPRYVLDILPYWFLLVLLSFEKSGLRQRHRLMIMASAALNCVLFVIFLLHYDLKVI
ncbi:MAG: hypothetical protein WCT10_00485 [Patescibacteria group bacterium]|jgi:hypothetical protein